MVHGNTEKWMEWYSLIDLIDKYRILIMLFEPNLKKCKLEQIDILNSWKRDNKMKDALDSIIDVFFIPESIKIYNNFSQKNNITYIKKEGFYNEFITLLEKYFDPDEILYILYSGNTSNLNKFGFSEQSYPIFSITYNNLISYWLNLIDKADFFTLIVSDINFNTVIDISHIDNHGEDPIHKDDYTVFFKTNKL